MEVQMIKYWSSFLFEKQELKLQLIRNKNTNRNLNFNIKKNLSAHSSKELLKNLILSPILSLRRSRSRLLQMHNNKEGHLLFKIDSILKKKMDLDERNFLCCKQRVQ